jgi:PKD domain
VVIAATLGLGLLAGGAHAASGVTVRLPGGAGERFVAARDIAAAADVPVTEYVLRSAGGQEESVFQTGTRLASVLALAGVDPAAVSFLELSRPDGSSLALPRDAIDPPVGLAPLVWVDKGVVGFIRPSAGPGDANERDSFSISGGAPLNVVARTGAQLTVSAEGGRRRVRAGGAVVFSGEATGAAPGEQLTYEWRFGDGTTATGTRVRHVFDEPGGFDVVLRVTGDGDSGGTSDPVSVQVGEPSERKQGDGSGDSTEQGAPQSGPQTGASPGGAAPAPPPAAAPAPVAPLPTPIAPLAPSAPSPPTPPTQPEPSTGDSSEASGVISGLRIAPGGQARPAQLTGSLPAARAGGEAPERSAATVPAGLIAAVALLALGVWREGRRG